MMLHVNGVSFQYKSTPVLDDIHFNVSCHEVMAILGPNGVGKTTLLKCMNAILKPDSGTIAIDGENILSLSPMEIARRLGYVAQKSESSRTTVFDAIILGLR
ncbi:MAG: ABC transporter ATP-binding protein, partial [Spirochaetales bacterium]|nr:ABC transporter ATP-binding protein [Spirochaetales bacterium]